MAPASCRKPLQKMIISYNNLYIITSCVTPPIQSYTNHTRKRVRSRSGSHGKISQHNSKNKISHTSQGPRGLEYKCSIIDESAEATISEYRHKLNKFALRRLAQTGIQIERGAGLLPGILLTTPGRRQRPARSIRHLQCRRCRRRRWRLAPGLQHLVATTRKKGKGKKGEESNREYSSKVLASKELNYICMGICVRRPYQWTELQNARIRGG